MGRGVSLGCRAQQLPQTPRITGGAVGQRGRRRSGGRRRLTRYRRARSGGRWWGGITDGDCAVGGHLGEVRGRQSL